MGNLSKGHTIFKRDKELCSDCELDQSRYSCPPDCGGYIETCPGCWECCTHAELVERGIR